MKIKLLSLIMACAFVGTSIAMEDDEPSLPAGTEVGSSIVKPVDRKVRAEKLAEINAACDTWDKIPWEPLRDMLRDAIEIYGIGLNEIRTNLLQAAVSRNDYAFARFLIDHGADVTTRDRDDRHLMQSTVRTFAMASLLKDKGASARDALFSHYVDRDQNLSLLFFKYGADVNETMHGGHNALTWVTIGLSSIIRDYWPHPHEHEIRARVMKNLILAGVPVNYISTFNGWVRGKTFEEIFACIEGDPKKISFIKSTIDSAKQEQADTRNVRAAGLAPLLESECVWSVGVGRIVASYDNPADYIVPYSIVRQLDKLDRVEVDYAIAREKRRQGLPSVLEKYIKGPLAIDRLIVSYDDPNDHIIPNNILDNMETVSCGDDQDKELAAILAEPHDKGDEKSNKN